MPILSGGSQPRRPDAWERVAQAVQIAGGLASTAKNVSDISSNIEQGKKLEAANKLEQDRAARLTLIDSEETKLVHQILTRAGVKFDPVKTTARVVLDTPEMKNIVDEGLKIASQRVTGNA